MAKGRVVPVQLCDSITLYISRIVERCHIAARVDHLRQLTHELIDVLKLLELKVPVR